MFARPFAMAKAADVVKDLWAFAATYLPVNLDRLALETGAMVRLREFESTEQLVRLLLLYASTNSFRVTSELARASGLVEVAPEAIFYRLRKSEGLLEAILTGLLDKLNAPTGFKLMTIDGTSLSGPASKGTDWRVHVGYDPIRGVPCSVSLTDAHGGENLRRHPLKPGWFVLADMAYGTPRNVHAAFMAGSDFLIRVPQKNIRLLGASGNPVNWKTLAEQVPTTGPVSFQLQMPVPPDGVPSGWKTKDAIACHPVRLIGIRNNAGIVVWLLTNQSLEGLTDEKACEFYRVRWQVELFFKRLKSLGDLDVLNSREGPTARAALLAKLILLVLTNLISDEEQAFSPYGYKILEKGPQPLARIRMRPQATHRMPATHNSKQKTTPRTASVLPT
jgi:hypothetical protein